ncbi:Alpha/beta superfamily hydrolase [Bacillus sp. OV322]|uniref:alpha/beta family hydrolase n=1 Tax=Bacillus sp. OV322 TaxID=1882764 RepID=UPI0008F38155|nr:alpha/beta hydrolase [Bacillus sp. OV322]SFC86537.1 Alpha/beta superfamily hydrolase [Bacillus sp. OV322]
MLHVKTNTVQGYKGMNIPFTMLSKKEDSEKLAILLPGAGYTVQAPILHYSTGVFINKSFDVLQVKYQYNNEFYADFSMDELSEAIKVDVHTVLDSVRAERTYENVYLIGKSIGTIAMSSVLEREEFKKAKAIWLTPLIQREDVLGSMAGSVNKGLFIIGDRDHHYSEEEFLKAAENPNITTRLIPNVNHSLEYEEDIVESIDVLKSIIKDIENF